MTISEFLQYVQIKSSTRSFKAKDFNAKKSSESTYLIEFKDSSSLNEMSLSIGFASGFIIDTQGNALTMLAQTTSVQTVTTVDS